MGLIFNPFRKPTAADLAKDELEASRRHQLQHEAAALYNQKMAEFHRENITRLQQHLGGSHG